MSQIKKYEQLPPALVQAQQENGLDLRVGDMFIRVEHHDSTIYRIVGFEKYIDKEHEERSFWMVQYQASNWEGTEWGNGYNGMVNDPSLKKNYKTTSLEDFKKYYANGRDSFQLERGKSLQEYFSEAADIIAGKIKMDAYRPEQTGNVSEDRAIMHRGSKEALITMQQNLEKQKEKIETIATFVKYEMERKRRELETIKQQLYGVVAEFQKKITRIMRVITTIELYLGIEEELFQLQDGPKASENDSICFRQQVLYMDEEMGIWKDGGLDYTDIGWFDKWLLQDNNFKKLLPESKGMIVFRPRRNAKHYTDDWFLNAMKNKENLGETYLLIRNGECLYRIYTKKIAILPRLFPKRKELEELLENTRKEIEENKSKWRQEEAKDKVDDIFYHYKQRAALMQGLIDRSEVFGPMATKVSIYKPDESGLIKFIYDDEDALPSGRLPFWDWVKKINASITEGSRILITGEFDTYRGYSIRTDYFDRFFNRQRESNTPALPKEGIYTVEAFSSVSTAKYRKHEWEIRLKRWQEDSNKKEYEKIKLLKVHEDWYKYGAIDGEVESDLEHYRKGDRDMYEVAYYSKPELTIKYNPKDTVYHLWDGYRSNERKYNLRFKIFTDDNFLLNYDQIDLDDINFYLKSRVDRPNYLSMMPLLQKIREHRLKEIANEKAFIRFLVDRNAPKLDGNRGEALKRALECVRWWKYKNKWKRSVSSDDTLALRMIEERLLDSRYSKLKHFNNNE